MTDGRWDTTGIGERRMRRLREKLAAEEAAGAPEGQVQMTRRQLRQAQQDAEATRLAGASYDTGDVRDTGDWDVAAGGSSGQRVPAADVRRQEEAALAARWEAERRHQEEQRLREEQRREAARRQADARIEAEAVQRDQQRREAELRHEAELRREAQLMREAQLRHEAQLREVELRRQAQLQETEARIAAETRRRQEVLRREEARLAAETTRRPGDQLPSPRTGYPASGPTPVGQPRPAEARPVAPRSGEPRSPDPRSTEPRPGGPRPAEPTRPGSRPVPGGQAPTGRVGQPGRPRPQGPGAPGRGAPQARTGPDAPAPSAPDRPTRPGGAGARPVVRRPGAGAPTARAGAAGAAAAGEAPRTTGRRPVVRPPAQARKTGTQPTGAIPTVPGSKRPVARPAASSASSVTPAKASRNGVPWWMVVVPLLAVVVAFGVWRVVGLGGDGGDDPSADGGGEQGTLVVALVNADSDVVGAALVGTDGESSSSVLIPSRLLVDVAGSGRVPLADALDTGDAAVGQAVEDALDVRVDATWILTTDGLSTLVDSLGGIGADVATAVSTQDVAIPAGNGQRLDGAQAATYATYLGEGEPEPARSARWSQVLSGVVGALPTAGDEVGAVLAPLGAGSRSTGDVGRVPAILGDVAATVRAAQWGATVLPVQEISTGDEQPVYGLDAAEVAALVSSRFQAAARSGGGDAVRVLVQNGAGTPGLGERARNRLVDAGFRYVGGGNATTLGQQQTVVAIPSDSTQDRERGTQVAQALGLDPGTVVAVGQEAPTNAEVVVVLGMDFSDVSAGDA